jgi:hypothetical protein
MTLLTFIEEAFAARQQPSVVVVEGHPPTDEYEDAKAFQGRNWREITCAELDMHPAAIFGFAPAAFCYFLPGIYSAGIRELRPDLLVNASLITMLDRANLASSWDAFFAARWPKLNPRECEATQRWLLWLADSQPLLMADASLARSYDTMDLLAKQQGATPLASWPRT